MRNQTNTALLPEDIYCLPRKKFRSRQYLGYVLALSVISDPVFFDLSVLPPLVECSFHGFKVAPQL